MTTEHNQELVKEEYLKLQKIVEDFDAKALTIKAWSVTLSASGIVTAYIHSEAQVLLIAGISAVIFWLTEALWKSNQQPFYKRIYEIEEWFRNPSEPFPPFQITSSWSDDWQERGKSSSSFLIMLWLHVAIPHVVISIIAFACYFFFPP